MSCDRVSSPATSGQACDMVGRRGLGRRMIPPAFEPLFTDAQYLSLLGPSSPDRTLVLLKAAIEASTDLDADLVALLGDLNWRPALVAATAIVMAPALGPARVGPATMEALWARLDAGSWVAPQLLVVLARVDPRFEERALARLARPAAARLDPVSPAPGLKSAGAMTVLLSWSAALEAITSEPSFVAWIGDSEGRIGRRVAQTWPARLDAALAVMVVRGWVPRPRMDLKIVSGDLLDQPVDVIVNAWNRNIIPWWLLIPQGVSGAIKRRAGYAPFRELGWATMPLGSARMTSAGRLPQKAIVHVAGIDMLWRASPTSVMDSTINAVKVAMAPGLYASIAFPVIGAGSGSMNAAEAEAVMVDALTQLDPPLDVVIVRYDPTTRRSS